jgi:hypothetical protein
VDGSRSRSNPMTDFSNGDFGPSGFAIIVLVRLTHYYQICLYFFNPVSSFLNRKFRTANVLILLLDLRFSRRCSLVELLPDYTVLQPRRQQSSILLLFLLVYLTTLSSTRVIQRHMRSERPSRIGALRRIWKE